MRIKKKNRGLPYTIQNELDRERDKCIACNGSGYYDWANPRTGKVPKCGACNGTGKKIVEDFLDVSMD